MGKCCIVGRDWSIIGLSDKSSEGSLGKILFIDNDKDQYGNKKDRISSFG